MDPVIDLRSDTVTRPTRAMREAMASAAVGDDVYGEDPTVNRLQDQVAYLLGKDRALLVPSGSMANQICIKLHTSPGDEVLAGKGAHSYLFESGAAPVISGVQITLLPGDGRFTADAVREAFKVDNHHFAPTRLVCVENTHNMGGGLLWNQDAVSAVCAAARELNLATHLDGARLWNASSASNLGLRELAGPFDTVSVCLSKGLGAPVGSVIAGSEEHIDRAHRVRKLLGGGMRQAGILAAAGLHAIEHHRDRLAEDHENAAHLAGALNHIHGLSVNLETVDTNIVMVDVTDTTTGATTLEQRAKLRNLLFVALSPRRFRLVTHLDVDRPACERAVGILSDLMDTA